jgi:hypothetical protein
MAESATFALKAALWLRLGLLVISTPVSGNVPFAKAKIHLS